MSGKYSFEIHVLRAGHWSIVKILDRRGAAEQLAENLFRQHDVEAVRVIRDWLRDDGLHSETEILRKERRKSTATGPRLLAAEIDVAPLCERIADLLQQAARTALTRVLRVWLAKEVVTATELLTSPALMQRILAQPELVGSAVGRVVRAQRKHCDEDPTRLSEQLHGLIDKIAKRARNAHALSAVQAFQAGEFSALCADLRDRHGPEKSAFIALAALSRRSIGARSWLGKLEVICAEAEAADAAALDLLDSAIADVLAAPGALQDILGEHKTLAAALHAIIDFRAGQWAGDHAVTAALAEMFRAGRLEQARSVLLSACVAGLAGARPLAHPDDTARERDALDSLLDHLFAGHVFTGGGAMAEAAVLRASRWMEHGGATGRREALELILCSLSSPRRRTLFLTELAGSPVGIEQDAAIDENLRSVLHRCQSVDDLLDAPGLSQLDKMEALVALHTRIDESLLRDETRQHCLDRLDALLADYIRHERVIESLDDPRDDLYARATRLVCFCSAGYLTPGRATHMARERVVHHLRQANFDERLVAHAAAGDRERMLREFHQLLGAAGFRTP